jgi:hypothetical protein
MPRVGSEPTTPAIERAKRVHALDRAATVNGSETIPAPQKTPRYLILLLLVRVPFLQGVSDSVVITF